jgi:hypothetical protein
MEALRMLAAVADLAQDGNSRLRKMPMPRTTVQIWSSFT